MFSMPDVAVILAVVLIVFGAGKLPEIGSALGKGIKDFKKAVEEKPPEEQEQKLEGPAPKPPIDDPSNAPKG
jgi:sec-independent protein translocase protein TatA